MITIEKKESRHGGKIVFALTILYFYIFVDFESQATLGVVLVAGVAAFIATMIQGILRGRKEKANLEDSGFNLLEYLGYNPDTKDVVLFNNEKLIRFNFDDDITNWTHKWVERSKNGSVTTTDHHIEFETKNYDHPILKGVIGNASNAKRFEILLANQS